jgi:hypothetical protein
LTRGDPLRKGRADEARFDGVGRERRPCHCDALSRDRRLQAKPRVRSSRQDRGT